MLKLFSDVPVGTRFIYRGYSNHQCPGYGTVLTRVEKFTVPDDVTDYDLWVNAVTDKGNYLWVDGHIYCELI